MKRVNRVLSYFVVACIMMQACLLISCGGSGGSSPLTTAKASREVARATTQPQMHKAMNDVAKISGYGQPVGAGSNSNFILPSDVQNAFEQLQINEPASAYPTLSDVYNLVNNSPDFASVKLGLSVTDVLTDLNGKLAAAYASPNTPPANATLVLLSSMPGAIPSVAPILTADTPLSPVQQLMFSKYMGTLEATRSVCVVACDIAYSSEIAAIVIVQAACAKNQNWISQVACAIVAQAAKQAAQDALAACLAACHAQGGIVVSTVTH